MHSDTEEESKREFYISVLDLLDFGGPNLMKSGDEVWKAGHVINVGVTSSGTEMCVIEALCIQSSNPNQAAHSITIKTAMEFKNWKCICSCKAGLGGKCKHIYAVLLHIHTERHVDIWTCTDQPQKWGKIAKEAGEQILEPERIRDMSEFRDYPRKEYEVTDEEMILFSDRYAIDTKSSLSIFVKRTLVRDGDINSEKKDDEQVNDEPKDIFHNFLFSLFNETDFKLKVFIFNGMPKTLLRFYNERICVSKDKAIQINCQTRDQNDRIWRYERSLRITASECYNLFTAYNNPRKGDVDFLKTVQSYYKPKPQTKNMKIGRQQEPNGLKRYMKHVNQTILKLGLIVHPSCPWIGCSPDGFCIETGTVVEVKTLMNENNDPFELAFKKIKYLKYSKGRFYLRDKHKYYAQIQLNMIFLKCRVGHLVVYNYKSNEIKVIVVDYDETFVKDLLSTLQKVYFNYILSYVFDNFVTDTDKKKYN